jgi:4'-phosphopantetheinyl transferase
MYARLRDLDDGALPAYLDKLPQFMRQDIMKYRNMADRKARLLARLILKACLERDGSGDLIHAWRKDSHHKPHIDQWKPFNISHSGDMVIFSYGALPNGIDVEEMRKADYLDLMRYFHEEEQLAITGAADKQKAFYEIWVRKEAFLKATGVGMAMGLHEFSCTGKRICRHGQDWHFRRLSLHPGYMAYLCINDDKDPILQERFLPKEFYPL